ncbi:sensor histidine kinase [Flavobacterium sp. 3HN19-14]|uniref:sensor histidine kinase n=1 Tax=Flavobacterium sp. 3HN19-14 TaxID=3448133 RepID=UPI003EE00112
MKKTVSYYATLCVLSFAFLMLPYIFTATGGVLRFPDFSNGHDRTYFEIYFILLVFFFVNYYVLIPKFYFHRKKVLYFTIIILALIFFLWFSKIFDRPLNEIFTPEKMPDLPAGVPPTGTILPQKPTQYQHTLLIYMVGIITSLFLASTRRLQKAETEKTEAELSFLKAQINPHFLFNTLNSIYSLAIAKDDRAADSIIQLSELMRYILDNANNDSIGLDREINYINNYILLQRSRLGDTAKIDYAVEGNIYGKRITPLILISFIENAFKHGVNPEENSEIDIQIIIEENKLVLFVHNNKVHTVQSVSGIGMKNTLERLEHLYEEHHKIEIIQNEAMYSIKLTMEL